MSQDIYFTSDTHFNHIKCCELFRSPRFIKNWNKRIKCSDKIYHLGDFALGRTDKAAEIAKRLNGQIFLIRGNHEKVAEHKDVAWRFAWIKDYHRVKVGEQKIYLFHYAMRTWNCMHHDSWSLYGHSHGSLPDDLRLRSFDVGVDAWDFKPVSYNEVAAKMATKNFVPVDHHGLEE